MHDTSFEKCRELFYISFSEYNIKFIILEYDLLYFYVWIIGFVGIIFPHKNIRREKLNISFIDELFGD